MVPTSLLLSISHTSLARIFFHQKQEVNSSDFFNRPLKYFLHRRNFCHSQSHPYGPGTCVGSKGSGWPGNWFECTAGWEEEPTSDRPGISSTECTGPGFSAFKASADRPAKRTRPLTSYPVSQSRVFTKLVTCFHRPVTKFITWFTEQEGRKYILCTHVYCDSSFLVPVIHLQRTGTDFSATDISRPVSLRLLWYKERTPLVRAYPRSWSRDFPTSSRSWSSSPTSQSRCPSDQQAGHVTHRPTFVSKYSSQGLSQQLSKSTNKTCVQR